MDIKPGLYVLSQDVTNPSPDRRVHHDWTRFPVWEAGTEVLVAIAIDVESSHASLPGKAHHIVEMTCPQGYMHQRLSKKQMDTVLPYLVSAQQSFDTMRKQVQANTHIANTVLEYLYDNNMVDRATVDTLMCQANDGTGPFEPK